MNVSVIRTAVIVATVLVVAACSAAEGSQGAPGTSSPVTSGSPVASEPSGVAPRDQGQVGSDDPILVDPMPGGNGQLTVPQPGQLDVHAVPVESFEAAVDGLMATVRISWTSGIEPCYVLDTIIVDKGEHSFAITLMEGHAPGDNVCIDIAKSKFALIDLGELAPGTYTVSDGMGGAAPIEFNVG